MKSFDVAAVVTGGASGLGEATIRALAAEGAAVTILDLHEDRGPALAGRAGRAHHLRPHRRHRRGVGAGGDRRGDGQGPPAAHRGQLRRHRLGPAHRRPGRRAARPRRVHDDRHGQPGRHLQRAPAGRGRDGDAPSRTRTASAASSSTPPRSPPTTGRSARSPTRRPRAGIVGMTLPAARDLSSVGVRVCTIAPGPGRHAAARRPPRGGAAGARRRAYPSRSGSAVRPTSPSWRWTSSSTATSTARSSAWTARCAWHRAEQLAEPPGGTSRAPPRCAAHESTWTPDWPLDLLRTLGPHRRGAGDPTMRIADDGVWRTTTTPDGPATVRIARLGRTVRISAWGPGAERAGTAVPEWLGALDCADGFDPSGHPVVAELHRTDAVAAARPHGPHVGRRSSPPSWSRR